MLTNPLQRLFEVRGGQSRPRASKFKGKLPSRARHSLFPAERRNPSRQAPAKDDQIFVKRGAATKPAPGDYHVAYTLTGALKRGARY
jgi:hypothetical protein